MTDYKELLDSLLQQKLTLSCMESLTGGMFASTFTSIPGASQAFKGGAVTYTDEIKKRFRVNASTIEKYGAVSKECAREMVLRCADFFQSDCAVSFTGNAGPGESEGKPVGMVFIGIKIKDQLFLYELKLTGERNDIRKQCVDFAFATMSEKLKNI